MSRVKGATFPKEKRREMILQAGLFTFCEMGYDGTSMDEIAKRAKCSHALLYYYFKSKEEIFTELVDRTNALLAQHAKLFSEVNCENPYEALRSATEKLLDYIYSDNSMFYHFQLTILLVMQNKDKFEKWNKKVEMSPFSALTNIIKAGQDKGVFKDGDLNEYANLYMALVNGLCWRKAFFKNATEKCCKPSMDMIMSIFTK